MQASIELAFLFLKAKHAAVSHSSSFVLLYIVNTVKKSRSASGVSSTSYYNLDKKSNDDMSQHILDLNVKNKIPRNSLQVH